ncbi:pachytene checkpoint protein 2-like protein [Dinothrombium tinctorium]|uniref:Pachytene checkpoint protein 2-like protein n=1 Tax=Dinothrombium tinctorium TaxID=1965070 RepID=A0A3S3QRS8_9ACAR|nr:pachytene checkpoint protein 2-like protein [Dinothrombium tinctorium]
MSVFEIEIELKFESQRSVNDLQQCIRKWIDEHKISFFERLENGEDLVFTNLGPQLDSDVDSLTITLSKPSFESNLHLTSPKNCAQNSARFQNAIYSFHVYKLQKLPMVKDFMLDKEDDIPSVSFLSLPSVHLKGLWESLLFDNFIKQYLTSFVTTSLLFSERNVNEKLITWNKVVLLHGPPGTGKTSLCKALAQKLSIKLYERFDCIKLVEINTHCLLSKYFSESGKLVVKLFTNIYELIKDPRNMIFILIDEVESLAHARQMSLNGNEPSDAVRVVNSILTQIDNIKNYPNVVILTTSNITGAIDLAFVDRADIKQYIGLPNLRLIYEIYRSCLEELMKKNIIQFSETILPYNQVNLASNFFVETFGASRSLYQVAL